ncbi:MAG: hypothetical protein AABY33_04115 [Pseudomonadota bacterium]
MISLFTVMSRIILAASIIISLVVNSGSVWAEAISSKREELKSYYPSLKEIYDDCKASINISKTDITGFLHSVCARQLNGIYNGYFQVLGRMQFVHDI